MILTVAIPVYERIHFFDKALNSAIYQYSPVKIIVVDNASSHNIFKEKVEQCGYQHIKYYRNSENLGMYGNWNKCVELCETEYVAILGDDDILEPSYTESFYNALSRHPEITFFHSNFRRFGDNYSNFEEPYNVPLGFHSGRELLNSAVKYGLKINTNAMIFKKNLINNFRFEFTNWAYNQDYLFAYTAFAEFNGYGESQKLVNVRINPGGNALIVGIRAYLSTALVYTRIAEYLKGMKSKYYKKAYSRSKWVLRNTIISGQAKIVKEMIDDTESPFGIHLKVLLENDWKVKVLYDNNNNNNNNNNNTVLLEILIVYFRFLRKFS